jgi:hypothetical protein
MSIIISEECSFDSCDGGFEDVRESRFAKLEPCQRLVALPAWDTAFPCTKSSNEAMNCISFMAATLLDSLPNGEERIVRELMVGRLICILTGGTSIAMDVVLDFSCAIGLGLCLLTTVPNLLSCCCFFVSLLHFVFLVYCSLCRRVLSHRHLNFVPNDHSFQLIRSNLIG